MAILNSFIEVLSFIKNLSMMKSIFHKTHTFEVNLALFWFAPTVAMRADTCCRVNLCLRYLNQYLFNEIAKTSELEPETA